MPDSDNKLLNSTKLLHLAFWIGFASLVYEIYSVKVLFLYFVETTYAVSITISAFLAGLAFSCLFFSKVKGRDVEQTALMIRLMQIALVAYATLVLGNYGRIPAVFDFFHNTFGASSFTEVAKGVFVWVYLFIPAFFIGGAFPLLTGLYLSSLETGVRETALVYFWDTFGSILGALFAGFILIPYLGLEKSLIVPITINCFVYWLLIRERVQYALLACIVIAAAMPYWLLYLESLYIDPDKQTVKILDKSELILESEDGRFGEVVFQEQSPFGVVTVGQGTWGNPENKTLFINYRAMCNSIFKETEVNIGDYTVKMFDRPIKTLNIGLGCGITAGAMANHSHVEALDIFEINPVVKEAAKYYFKEENNDVLGLPKVNLSIRDGAEFIRNTKTIFDAIVIDIEEVSVIYSSPLYTQDYFKIIKKLLPEDGVFAIWAVGETDFSKVLYNTLKSVYKHVEIKTSYKHLNFFASDRPLNIPVDSEKERTAIAKILAATPTEINTIDNRALERYFNIEDAFNLHNLRDSRQLDVFIRQ